MRSFFGLTLVLPVATSACVASISGEVDGEAPASMQSAFLMQPSNLALPDEKEGLYVVFASFPEACTVFAEQTKQRQDALEPVLEAGRLLDTLEIGTAEFTDAQIAFNDEVEEASEECADWDEEHLPAEFWTATVSIAVKNLGALKPGDSLVVDGDSANATSNVALCRQDGASEFADTGTAWSLPAYFAVEGDDNRECFFGSDGAIELVKFDSRTTIEVQADVALEDDNDDDAGEIVLRGAAPHCVDAEDALDELMDEMAQ